MCSNEVLSKRRHFLLQNCNKHKHKGYVNDYGVSWCIACGLLMKDAPEPLIDPETRENKTFIFKIK
jgi:hypothetical protein